MNKSILALPLLFLAQALIPFTCFAQGAIPIRFEEFSFSADISVHFEEFSFSADETWYVSGSCEGVFDAPRIHVEEFSFSADITVHLGSTSLGADRTICIVNPEDAPKEFWEAYDSR